MDPSAQPAPEAPPAPTAQIAGVGRRLAALIVDLLVLSGLGLPLGIALGDRLAPAGSPGRLLGLAIAIPYLGILGSAMANGQTVGKRLTGLRVVDASGRPLPPARALVRAALLALPWMLSGVRSGARGPAELALLGVTAVVLFGLGGAIAGATLLNRRTHQGLHDLLVGSFVVQADPPGPVPARSTPRALRASGIWVAFVAVATTVTLALAPGLVVTQVPPALLERIAAIPGATSAELRSVKPLHREGDAKVLIAVLWYRGPVLDTRKAALDVAAAMLEHHPQAAEASSIAVTVIRGWDVGIASRTESESFGQTPAQWREELERR